MSNNQLQPMPVNAGDYIVVTNDRWGSQEFADFRNFDVENQAIIALLNRPKRQELSGTPIQVLAVTNPFYIVQEAGCGDHERFTLDIRRWDYVVVGGEYVKLYLESQAAIAQLKNQSAQARQKSVPAPQMICYQCQAPVSNRLSQGYWAHECDECGARWIDISLRMTPRERASNGSK